MDSKTFPALVVTELTEGSFSRQVVQRTIEELPAHEVLVKVKYASLNFKDALSATGHKGVTRNYPHTPGIDAAGVVEESQSTHFSAGEEVVVTGFDLGMNTPGSFAGYVRVPEDWILPKPEKMTLRESMIYGTAGLTAGIGLYKMMQNQQKPENGPILITGASGGVGSLAVRLFSCYGFEIIASTGKEKARDMLSKVGATSFLDRKDVDDVSGKPLLSSRWAGALDTVGGNILATAIKACKPNGNIATCGNVLGSKLSTTIFPFILNGVNLLGIDSARYPLAARQKIWQMLADQCEAANLDEIAIDCRLEEIDPYIDEIMDGKVMGRVIINFD